MMQRQQLFARLGKQRIDQVDARTLKEPLPVIFVILDEFSIMSQAIAESPVYKLRLQNLLAKGAALGIKFLFSSQTFTTGVAGLTATARAQIQQRIAMKGSREEISETLELSSRLKTEQVRNWMDALPPHYSLVKSRKDADTPPEVHRDLVLYFKDYTVRDNLITMIRNQMIPVGSYEPDKLNTYVDKQPVLVDGKAYEQFSKDKLTKAIQLRKQSGDSFGNEVYVSAGVPRLMTNIKLMTLTAETRENVLLLARGSEQACAQSVITSFMRSFLLQKKKVTVWAYGKNRLYKEGLSRIWTGPEFFTVKFHVDNDAVCDAIYELKQKIQKREAGDELIVLLGMDRICGDFEFGAGASAGTGVPVFDPEEYERKKKQREEELIRKGAVVTTKEQQDTRAKALAWGKEKNRLTELYKGQGLSEGEIKEKLAADCRVFMGMDPVVKPSPEVKKEVAGPESSDKKVEGKEKEEAGKEKEHEPGAYDAGSDFVQIIKQGSRLGYHFLMVVADYSDLKQTSTKIDLYRHRMAFATDVDTSREVFSSRVASQLPEHICQYSNQMEQFSFRPYLHPGITWEGWYVDEKGVLVSPFVQS